MVIKTLRDTVLGNRFIFGLDAADPLLKIRLEINRYHAIS
jgi:hypothetical protein